MKDRLPVSVPETTIVSPDTISTTFPENSLSDKFIAARDDGGAT